MARVGNGISTARTLARRRGEYQGNREADVTTPSERLLRVKLLHTAVWAFFAGCILAIPVLAWGNDLRLAAFLAAVVALEVVVLAFNDWSCPLTPVAARYTDDRRSNFDIFLPEWLARYNKEIFGSLYLAGLLAVAYRWLL